MSRRLSTEMHASFEFLDRDADTRRLTMVPPVVAGPVGDGLSQRRYEHVDLLLIHACRHSTAASNSKDLESKHLNNRAIFGRVGALHITLQRARCSLGARIPSRAAGSVGDVLSPAIARG